TRPLTSLVQFGSTLQELKADANRLDDVLRYPQDEQYTRATPGDAADKRQVKLDGRVELRGLTFGYSPLEKPLIEDFTLTVEPGRRVAQVGASGSGKSTAAKLVSGHYRPWRGEIRFGGVLRDELPRELVVDSVGLVAQDLH